MPYLLLILLILAGCKRPVPTTTPVTPLATVAVSPTDITSPFLCRITAAELSCLATIDVRFKRGESEVQFPRGHQFMFSNPKGSGTAVVWFGCAGSNSCSGYFMFGSNTVSVTPQEPARFWNAAPPGIVPEGSLGIVDVTVEKDTFIQLANRWTGSTAPHILKPGNGTTISCTNDTCTVGLK